jgi:hypothetical protein
MKRNWWAASLVAVLVLIGGCKGGHDQNSTQMRALNAVVDAEPLDVLIDDNVTVTAVAVGQTSSYHEFTLGTRDVKIRSSTSQAILSDKSIGFNGGANTTLLMYGKRASIVSTLLVDDTTDPSSGHFKIRVSDLSPDVGAVDVYVVTGDITASAPTVASVGYGSTTDYVELVPGNYQFVYTTAGTKDILFQSQAQSLAAGGKFTIGVFPATSGKLVNGVLLTGDGGTFMPNSQGRIKAVNAIPDSPGLNFKSDSVALLSNVPFAGSSSYVTLASGSHTLTLESSAIPGVSIASNVQQVAPAKDYTVIAVNALATAQQVVLTDDNSLPSGAQLKLRFVNVLVGGGPVDVLLNFATQTSGLAYGAASLYAPLAPTLTGYTVTFATPGGVTVISTLNTGEVDAGGIYTAYLMGTPASPQVRLVRDR